MRTLMQPATCESSDADDKSTSGKKQQTDDDQHAYYDEFEEQD